MSNFCFCTSQLQSVVIFHIVEESWGCPFLCFALHKSCNIISMRSVLLKNMTVMSNLFATKFLFWFQLWSRITLVQFIQSMGIVFPPPCALTLSKSRNRELWNVCHFRTNWEHPHKFAKTKMPQHKWVQWWQKVQPNKGSYREKHNQSLLMPSS